jgi:signal transduction histidine kinase
MASIPREEAGSAARGTHSPAASGTASDTLLPVPESEAQHLTPESLATIPSPSRRLWIGLCIVLSIFVVFAVYATHEVHWLEQFQGNVVQRNRKASLQLLRLQSDIYLLAISLREMNDSQSRYPIPEWEPEFNRLHRDIDDAIRLEASYAVAMGAADDKRAQLGVASKVFWEALQRAFALARAGQVGEARTLVQSEVESKRGVLSEIVSRLLVLNDQAQAEAAETINTVYGSVKREILVVVGVLFLLALATGLYTLQANRKTFEKLQHLAEQLRLQSEQLRHLSWKLIEVQEETLRQVSRDLHDEFGQILTAIGALLSRTGRKSTDMALLQDLDLVKTIVQDTLQKVRDQSQMFRPAILDDFGLEQTLEWFVAQFSRQTAIKVHLEGEITDGRLPPEAPIHVYRIVQEALSNVARHSGAREASLKIVQQDGALCLEIRDNGTGFQPRSERSRSGGVGLMGMRERAEHLNGSLEIRSAPGKGTEVSVRIPLSPEGEVQKQGVGTRQSGVVRT